MNVLIKKEIRLLLPAWGMVIVLTALSARYIGSPNSNTITVSLV